MPEIARIGARARMSDVVVHEPTIYTRGYVAKQSAGRSVAEQTEEVLAQLDEALQLAGSTRAQLLTVTIWLADIQSLAELNAVWDAWIGDVEPPARACVEARLASPEWAVEISAVAARGALR